MSPLEQSSSVEHSAVQKAVVSTVPAATVVATAGLRQRLLEHSGAAELKAAIESLVLTPTSQDAPTPFADGEPSVAAGAHRPVQGTKQSSGPEQVAAA